MGSWLESEIGFNFSVSALFGSGCAGLGSGCLLSDKRDGSVGAVVEAAMPAPGRVVLEGLFVQLDAENGIEQFDIADFFILQIANLYGRHILTPFEWSVVSRQWPVFDCLLLLPTADSRFPHHYKTSVSSRHCTADHKQIVFGIDLGDR